MNTSKKNINTAIILAGGLGTRLRSVVSELPKCMAPVNGKPFISYVIEAFSKQGITNFIFALGYKSEAIIEHIDEQYFMFNNQYSIEEEPLGTGGAIKLALSKATNDNVFITNGDTLYNASLQQLSAFHLQNASACTLALKPMENFDRYGVVEIDANNRITSFKEKKQYDAGLINGGLYALNIPSFNKINFTQKFSFEKDYLEAYYKTEAMYGFEANAYFIDIGIPVDFAKAQNELR